jgi:hypothetical protein
MSAAPHLPHDENGDILRRMYEQGDNLKQPRIIDFCFAFPERRQAIAFADMLDARNLEVCISYYDQREMWQAIVKKYMLPTHDDITSLESGLTVQAEQVGGEADGWGCMLVKSK